MSQSHNPGNGPTGRKTPARWVRQHKDIAYRLYDSAPHDRAFECDETDLDAAEWGRYHRTAKQYGAITVETYVTARPAECERNTWTLSEGFIKAVEARREREREGWCENAECIERHINHTDGEPVCGVCGAPIQRGKL